MINETKEEKIIRLLETSDKKLDEILTVIYNLKDDIIEIKREMKMK